MKTKILFIFTSLIFSGLGLFCQTQRFEYTYDAAGNRIRRELIVLPSPQAKDAKIDTIINNSNDNFDILIFPNPVSEVLNIEFLGNIDDSKIEYEVFNINGQLIENKYIKSNATEIYFANLQTGVYFVRLKIDDKYKEYKILKSY